MIQKQNSEQVLTDKNWENLMGADRKKFHKLGFPDKLDHLRDLHGITVDSRMRSQNLLLYQFLAVLTEYLRFEMLNLMLPKPNRLYVELHAAILLLEHQDLFHN